MPRARFRREGEEEGASIRDYRVFAGVCDWLKREYPRTLTLLEIAPLLDLDVSPNRVSQVLSKLERYYGVASDGLIHRSSHQGCSVTPKGWSFYRQVREVLDRLDTIGRTDAVDREVITVAGGHAV